MSLTLGMPDCCLSRLISQLFSVKLFSGARLIRRREFTRTRSKGTNWSLRCPSQSGVDPNYLQLNQATARGARNSFCPTDDIHLGEDCLHMRLHSAFTDKKGGADLFVALSLSH